MMLFSLGAFPMIYSENIKSHIGSLSIDKSNKIKILLFDFISDNSREHYDMAGKYLYKTDIFEYNISKKYLADNDISNISSFKELVDTLIEHHNLSTPISTLIKKYDDGTEWIRVKKTDGKYKYRNSDNVTDYLLLVDNNISDTNNNTIISINVLDDKYVNVKLPTESSYDLNSKIVDVIKLVDDVTKIPSNYLVFDFLTDAQKDDLKKTKPFLCINDTHFSRLLSNNNFDECVEYLKLGFECSNYINPDADLLCEYILCNKDILDISMQLKLAKYFYDIPEKIQVYLANNDFFNNATFSEMKKATLNFDAMEIALLKTTNFDIQTCSLAMQLYEFVLLKSKNVELKNKLSLFPKYTRYIFEKAVTQYTENEIDDYSTILKHICEHDDSCIVSDLIIEYSLEELKEYCKIPEIASRENLYHYYTLRNSFSTRSLKPWKTLKKFGIEINPSYLEYFNDLIKHDSHDHDVEKTEKFRKYLKKHS
jgi:hypothetical protein